MSTEPTVSRIAGQLGYLFDDQPELRDAPSSALADRLDAEDRASRARAEYPLASDAGVASHAAALDRRVTEAMVTEARRSLSSD